MDRKGEGMDRKGEGMDRKKREWIGRGREWRGRKGTEAELLVEPAVKLMTCNE